MVHQNATDKNTGTNNEYYFYYSSNNKEQNAANSDTVQITIIFMNAYILIRKSLFGDRSQPEALGVRSGLEPHVSYLQRRCDQAQAFTSRLTKTGCVLPQHPKP